MRPSSVHNSETGAPWCNTDYLKTGLGTAFCDPKFHNVDHPGDLILSFPMRTARSVDIRLAGEVDSVQLICPQEEWAMNLQPGDNEFEEVLSSKKDLTFVLVVETEEQGQAQLESIEVR